MLMINKYILQKNNQNIAKLTWLNQTYPTFSHCLMKQMVPPAGLGGGNRMIG